MAAIIKILVQTEGGIGQVEKDIQSLGDTAEKAGGGFSSLREIAVGALREVGALAVNALGQAAQATVGFLKDSVSLAGDFQAGMLEFQAVAGQSVDTAGLEEFHDLFIQIGKDMPVSTSDVQKAAIELVKGGIDPATVAAGGLESAIKFAGAAMGGDLAAAAEVSAKVVGGWADVSATAAEKADLLTHSADLLTKAANASTVDVHDLALGLYNVQGTAKTVGLSLDETTTALAELAPRFSNANTAGTSFRNFLIRLQPTTDPAIGAMQALGLYTKETGSAFYDAQGEFIGIAEASNLLQQATAGLTDAEKTLALQTIFGNDAMNAAAAFAEMGAEGYNNMTAALANANGVAANAELKQQGFNTAVENVKGSIEALQITIGEKLLPVLGTLINDYIAPAINSVTEIATAFFDAGPMSSEFGESMDLLGQSLGLPANMLQNIVFGLQDFARYIMAVIEDGDYLNDFLTELPAPMQGVVATIGYLVASFQEGGMAFTMLQDRATSVFGTLQTYIPGVLTSISLYTDAITKQMGVFWDAHGADIMATVQEVWDAISDIYNATLAIILIVVGGTLKEMAGFITAHGAEIQQILTGVWEIIKGLVTGALAIIGGVLKTFLALLKGDWDGAWNEIKTMTMNVASALEDILTGLWNILQALFQLKMNELMAKWSGLWDDIKAYVSTIDWAALGMSVIDGITGGVLTKAGELVDTVVQTVKDAYNAAVETVGMGSPAKVFIPLGKSMPEGMAVGIMQGAPLVSAAAANAAYGGVQGASNVVNNYHNTLNFAPSYTGGSSTNLDYTFAKSLAGVI